MSLTKDDLTAIENIVQKVVDKAIDDSDIRTANGFAEMDMRFEQVDERLDTMDEKFTKQIKELADYVTVRDNKLEDTVQRVDRLMVHVGIV